MTKEIVRLIVRLLMTSTSPGTSSAATSSMHSQFHVNLFSLVITSPVHYAPLFFKEDVFSGAFLFPQQMARPGSGLQGRVHTLVKPNSSWLVCSPATLSACVSLSLTSESSLRAPWWVTALSGAGATQQGSQQCGTSIFFFYHTYTHTHITFNEGD